jgi:TRAP-type C4-dicarboxylate transport system substrate-binding protein
MLIDKRVFGKIAAADQAIAREVMEGIYQGFDAQGVTEDRAAYQALLDEGLERVSIDDAEAREWQALIDASNEQAASEGVVPAVLLEELECYLAAFRAGAAGDDCRK